MITDSGIQVSVRIKPFIAVRQNKGDEKKQNSAISSLATSLIDEDWIQSASKTFAVNTWDSHSSQSDVYFDFIRDGMIPAFEQGLDCTCFLYGQTGSGKTHTLFGPPNRFQTHVPDLSDLPSYWGLFPRCVLHFLQKSPPDGGESIVFISMVELYQSKCYDLLNNHARVSFGGSRHTRESSHVSVVGAQYDANGKWQAPFVDGKENSVTVELQGQKEVPIRSSQELMRICQKLESVRHTNAHALNDRSSRSHCIVSVRVPYNEQYMRFVDLAGSEKIKQTKVSGLALQEAKSINASLSALGRVLVQLNQRAAFVNYRDAPLTMLLKDALGGHCKSSIIVTVESQRCMEAETRNTLRFGQNCAKAGKRNRRKSMERPKTSARLSRIKSSNIGVESLRNTFKALTLDLKKMEKQHLHGHINPEFPPSTANTFLTNKRRFQGHLNRLAKCQQRLAEWYGQQANHTVQYDEKKTAMDRKELMKEVEFEEMQVKVLKGIVIRQMTTGVWIPPKRVYSQRLVQRNEIKKQLKRIGALNGLTTEGDTLDDDTNFSDIQDLLLDFTG